MHVCTLLTRITSRAQTYQHLTQGCVSGCCWAAAGVLECSLEASNTGNVRLTNFSLAGDAVNCAASTIPPGGSVQCLLRKNVTTQQLSAAGLLDVSFPFKVAPAGLVTSLQSPPFNIYTASLPTLIGASPECDACRSCLVATRTFVQSQPADSGAAATAAAFGDYCAQDKVLRQSPLCSKVKADIEASTFGNLGRRAAGLCFSLQLCNRVLGAHCAVQPPPTNGSQPTVSVSTADVDLCTGKECCMGQFCFPARTAQGHDLV